MNKNLKNIKRKIIPVLKKYKVSKAGIFGSFSRQEENKKYLLNSERPETFIPSNEEEAKLLKRLKRPLRTGYLNVILLGSASGKCSS